MRRRERRGEGESEGEVGWWRKQRSVTSIALILKR